MKITFEHNAAEIARAFEQLPGIMRRAIDNRLGRGAAELAVEARAQAPKAFSTLTQAILAERLGPMDWQVKAGTDYARMVEQGTGPGGWPPPQTLIDWIRIKRIEPEQGQDLDSLAYLIGRKIFRRGTPAQPFMAPSLAAKESRLKALVREGVQRGLAEVARRA